MDLARAPRRAARKEGSGYENGSTLFLTTDFDVMTRASFLDRVITMQLDSKYRRNLVFCQSVIARKSP